MALVMVMCGMSGCLAPSTPVTEGSGFHQMTMGYDDLVIFSIIPFSKEPGTYVLNYKILKNETTYESGFQEVYENVSEFSPIQFTVPRSSDDCISLQIEVRNSGGDILHRSNTTISPVFNVIEEKSSNI